MQSVKQRGDVLLTITEKLSRQHIARHVSGCNRQVVKPVLIQFFSRDKQC